MKNNNLKEATLIKFSANQNKITELSSFLEKGSQLVKQNEPNTIFWFALQENNNKNNFGIFDVFPNDKARNEHFSGKVANALKNNAHELVINGWENGILKNINNFSVLSAKLSTDLHTGTEATFIKIKAAQGKSQQLANLLTAAAEIIKAKEPKTLFWVALQLDDNTYGIFDIFTDESGRTEHFSGEVALALKEQSLTLVENGWDDGVLRNIVNYKILAMK